MQDLKEKVLLAGIREEGYTKQIKELLDRLAQPQAVEKVKVPLQSQKSEQAAPTTAIELKEPTLGGPAYTKRYNELMEKAVPAAREKMRMERYLFE